MVKNSGLLKRTVASASAVMRQSGSIVVDNRHAGTLRLNQSMTATDVTGRCPSEDIGGLCGIPSFPKRSTPPSTNVMPDSKSGLPTACALIRDLSTEIRIYR